jgi:hypothetical protein
MSISVKQTGNTTFIGGSSFFKTYDFVKTKLAHKRNYKSARTEASTNTYLRERQENGILTCAIRLLSDVNFPPPGSIARIHTGMNNMNNEAG